MAVSDKKFHATIAALDWVGSYEDDDPENEPGDYTPLSIEDAFTRYKTAAAVKRECGFPEDMVDAYDMLKRMYEAQLKARQKETR